MKRTSLIIFLLPIAFIFNKALGQQLFTENFNYTATQLLTANTWTQNGFSATNPISVASSGLSQSGYVLSGVGNSAVLTGAGQDIYKDLVNTATTGNVYMSFMLNLATAHDTGDYFIGLLPTNNTNNYGARVYARLSSSGYYKLAVTKSTETAKYTTDSFPISNGTILVVKYRFNTGLRNDTVSLYNIPSGFPTTEPATATIISSDTVAADMTSIGRIALRQGGARTAPDLLIDGIRVATTWADLNAPTINYPGKINFVFINTLTSNSLRINLNANAVYDTNTMRILVFLKKDTSILGTSPNLSANYYTADPNFAGSGTPYQLDALGKCVYNGTSTTAINITGLQALTRYYATAFIVTKADSLYSAGVSGNGTTTSTAPGNVNFMIFTATGPYSITLRWNKSTNYNNAIHTQMVFVKPLTAITAGTNRFNPSLIVGDTNYKGIGSLYPFDAQAKCVYNGDTNQIAVSGLNAGTTYYVMLLGANVNDSVYANPTLTNGITNGNGPTGINFITFTSNAYTTARIAWPKPTGYNNATSNTLIYVKEATAINPGVPDKSSVGFIDNSDFSGASSKLQFDSLAKLTYMGDSAFVNLTNLKAGTRYYVSAYVVSDSLYSTPRLTNGTTKFPPPSPVSAATFVGTASNSATIAWVKNANYVNATYSTLVFVKPVNPINLGTPSRRTNFYIANTNIANGTRYQNDTGARCVFRADTNFVNITGLVSGVKYYVAIYVIRDQDSTYSTEALTSGFSLVGVAPYYTIGQVNQTNTTTGAIDSLNVRVILKGVVYGGNTRGTTLGLQFVMKDLTGGITVYTNVKSFGYTPVEGDSIEVRGIMGQVRGLSIINATDTIIFKGSGNAISSPNPVTKAFESTENDLVRIAKLNLIVPISTWPTGNTIVKAIRSGSKDTVNIQLFSSSALGGLDAPTGEFTLTGLGSQISSSLTSPYAFDGYQVYPRNIDDISNIPDTILPFDLVAPAANGTVLYLGGDTNQVIKFSWTKAVPLVGTPNPVYHLLVDIPSGNYSIPFYNVPSSNNGLDTFVNVRNIDIARSFQNLNIGDSLVIKWTVSATSTNYLRYAVSSRKITFKRILFTAVSEVDLNNEVILYPNPSTNFFNVQSPIAPDLVSIYDMSGKLIVDYTISDNYPIQQIPQGIYFVRIKFGDQEITKKLIITQ